MNHVNAYARRKKSFAVTQQTGKRICHEQNQGQQLRVPHMGWNQIEHDERHPLLKGIRSGSYFYFVHSYALEVTDATLATCDYGTPFTAIVGRDNFFGAQFHPERSGSAGARLLQNFLEL